ncbi:DUF6376 family protein [Metabacillus sp. 84]|uniref:DUF6376 family protein n=1 Tax=Metabacillus sp. 84 TaxID=3404705 RepID=UPI003CEE74B6
MKGFILSCSILNTLLLFGCSMPSKPAPYGEEAAMFARKLSAQAENTSTLFIDAAESETARMELETILISMKQQIEEFNKMRAPEQLMAHRQELVSKNRRALSSIDEYLTAIENDAYTEDMKSNTDLSKQIEGIQSMAGEINRSEEKK